MSIDTEKAAKELGISQLKKLGEPFEVAAGRTKSSKSPVVLSGRACELEQQPHLPDSIFMFGRRIKVIYDPNLCDETTKNILYGSYNNRTDTIAINPTYPPDIQLSTLLHEVIHVIENNCNLDLKEETVVALEIGLMTALASFRWR